jgi:uncharacterized protein (DUF305 family)
MRIPLAACAASASIVALFGIAFAQESDMQGHDTGAMQLPAACQSGEAPAMPGMEDVSSAMEGMGGHQKAMMEGMMATQQPMMQGMMAEDADVAFACAMIPHHQAAITMAEVELEKGDAGPMRDMAQKVIDAQTREIEELTRWLEEQGQ